jgi:hypothetical protein
MKSKLINPLSAALILIIIIAIPACKKDFSFSNDLTLSTNSVNTVKSVLVNITDAANAATIPANVNVSISGQDASYIHDLSGNKNFSVYNGSIQFSVDPVRTTAGGIISFYVELTAPGYLPETQEITITPSTLTQQVNVEMTNINTPPAGTNIAVKTFALSGGTMPTTGITKINQSGLMTNSIETNQRGNGISTFGLYGNNDTTYYDDGLTSVVLPQGTTFYYYQHVKTTITITDSIQITKAQIDSIQSANGTSQIYVRQNTYYEKFSYTYPVWRWNRIKYTGDSIKVLVSYNTGTDVNYSSYRYPNGVAPTVPLINILNGGNVSEDELLFKSAVSKKITNLNFYGKDNNGNLIVISPDSSYKWFSSFVINKNFINSVTGQPVQAGDSLETGINGSTLRTRREVVTQAANGQLRAQIQSNNIGLYYHAPNIATYNYNFTSYLNPANIPDRENASAIVRMGYVTISLNGTNKGNYVYAGKICSARPISSTPAVINYYYWHIPAGTTSFNNGMNVFSNLIIPNPKSNFYITIQSLNNPSTTPFAPTGYLFAKSNSMYGVAYLQKGYWSTRIIPATNSTTLPPLAGAILWNGKIIIFDTQHPASSFNITHATDSLGNFVYNLQIFTQ